MFKLVLVAVIILGICFLGMAIRIIFHRSHKFPETSIERNAQMRKLGITCPKHDELRCYKTGENRDCASCTVKKE